MILDKSAGRSYVLTIPGQTTRNDIEFIEAFRNPASKEFKLAAAEVCDNVST